jgi:hypothetical protein
MITGTFGSIIPGKFDLSGWLPIMPK